jgi:hypothetical protein
VYVWGMCVRVFFPRLDGFKGKLENIPLGTARPTHLPSLSLALSLTHCLFI